MYGIIQKFLRAGCTTVRKEDFALVKWFQPPEYPDGDPLWVQVKLHGPDTQEYNFLSLEEIDPSRVLYERVDRNRVHMMRLEGGGYNVTGGGNLTYVYNM